MIGVLGDAEGRAVIEDTAAADHREFADGEEIAVDLDVDDAPGMRTHAIDATAHELFDIAVELLEMLGPEEHPLGPYDFVIPVHKTSKIKPRDRPKVACPRSQAAHRFSRVLCDQAHVLAKVTCSFCTSALSLVVLVGGTSIAARQLARSMSRNDAAMPIVCAF